jgi:hypothetical protein
VVVNAVSMVIASFDSRLGSAGKSGSAFGLNVLICTASEFYGRDIGFVFKVNTRRLDTLETEECKPSVIISGKREKPKISVWVKLPN